MSKKASAAPAVLITMPHSHYSEKARWALDWLNLPYREEPHVPLLHRLATGRHGGRSVPLLRHGATRLTDSADIVRHADAICGGDLLYPREEALRREVERLQARFDDELGPHTRRWAYAQLLPQQRLLRRVMSRGVPRLEAWLLPLLLPAVVRLIRSAFRITPESTQRSLARVRELFEEVGAMLRDGRRYLVGGRFTAADLSFAALAAPVLFPDGCRAAYPTLDEVPAAMRAEVQRLRETEAGQFALRMFAQQR
ncbi:glutathione S-transferase family protein [Roseateles violae]|uniref:Glutathione S-transferase family protein n=1 Tax=Roseateles violae TaxID=3058042 RepID=A0ABT8DM34_9BURK|nr:glutathione S-transferase family protein [Pelomonas sp. PFR6]MDN3918978.1 glutathione S-transferase family protein [Pelomonas sp. PFR6]